MENKIKNQVNCPTNNDKKQIATKRFVFYIVTILVLVLLFVTVWSLSSGKEVTQVYKITYGSKENVSGDDSVIIENRSYEDTGFGFDMSKSRGAVSYSSANINNSAYGYDLYEDSVAVDSVDIAEDHVSMSLDDLKVKGNYLKWTYDTSLETTEFDKLISDLAIAVKDAGGYVEQTEVLTSEYRNNALTETYMVRRGTYTIRIPDNEMDSINKVLSNADVKSSNQYCEDLTANYIDTQTKLDYLKKEYDKLQDLSLTATNIQDVLAINDRMTEIEQQLDAYSKTMDQLDKDIQYATLYLTVDEVKYYEDTVIAYSSEIMQNWARIATEWLSSVLPTAFLLFITGLPFLLTIGFTFYYVSKKKIDYSCKKLNESEKEYHQD